MAACYVQALRRATDPNGSGLPLDMWIVWQRDLSDDIPFRQIAYCSRQEDAERICWLVNEQLGQHAAQRQPASGEG